MLPVHITAPFQDCGLFGAKRKHDMHTGLDLYAEQNSAVRSITEGTVIDVFEFTGEFADSPWWNSTKAIVVESGELTYVYGEVKALVEVGDKVCVGEVIGEVLAVLKVDKGVTPTSMLHLEIWETQYYKKNFVWLLGQKAPRGLLNPINHLLKQSIGCYWIVKTQYCYKVEGFSGEHLGSFVMAADCKAFLESKPVYLLKNSCPLETKLLYTLSTGKALWFDCKGQPNY